MGAGSSVPSMGGLLSSLSSSMTYDDAFELTGHGMFNNYVLACCSCIFMHSLVEMVACAYITDPAECDIHFTILEKTLVGNGCFIGIVTTAICWGTISDQLGRRRVMLPAVISACLFSILSSLATSFVVMFIFRIIAGVFVSASSATVLVYLGELHTLPYRDVSISIAVTTAAIIFVVVPAVGWVIIPGKWSFAIGSYVIKPWRVFMWTWSIPGLTGAIILFLLPESPNFTLAKSGAAKALPVIAKIWSWNKKQPVASFPVKELKVTPPEEGHVELQGLAACVDELKNLLKPPLLRVYLITHFCMFMTFLLANGVYMWMPGIYNLISANISVSWTICDAIKIKYADPTDNLFPNSPFGTADGEPFSGGGGGAVDCSGVGDVVNPLVYPMSIGMELTFLVPFIIVTIIIDKVNKVRLYAYVMLPCACGLVLCVVVPKLAIAGVLLTIGLCSGSAASILSALAVEVFPTSVRALAMCTMYMFGQIGAILGNTAVSFGATGPCTAVFIMIGALVVASIASIILLWPNVPELRATMEARHFTF